MEEQKQKQGFNHGEEIAKMIEVMPEKMRNSFQRVVMAGKKILYSPETMDIIREFMDSDAPTGEKLGAGIANLVVMIDNKANGQLPKDIIIPAATVLLFDASDALSQAGYKITSQDMGQAYEVMFYNIFASYGAKPEQVDEVFGRLEKDVAGNESGEPKSQGQQPSVQSGGMIQQGV